MAKLYDRAYFDTWYRREGFGAPGRLQRKVHFAVAAAEYLLERRIRSVLDVGCGEGVWQPALHSLRPAATYLGVDSSSYAVDRFGRRRNLRRASVGELDSLDLGGPFDLVVCIDVLPYVEATEARRALHSIGRMLGGVALIELFTAADDFEGDRQAYRRRSPSVYERWFRSAGLDRIGPNLFTTTQLTATLASFERPR